MTWTARIQSAWHLITKGSVAPWDQVPLAGSGQGDKLTKPYAQSVWIQRAIKKVAQPIAAVSLQFSKTAGKSTQLLTKPELTDYWASPARNLSRSDWIEATVGWMKLAGESFWLLGDETLPGALPLPFPEEAGPAPIIVARPDRMKHAVEDGSLVGWEFTDGQHRRHLLLPEQVVQLKFWNPYDDWRGLGEVEAATIAAESDYLAGKFARNLMANNGDRGPYVVAKSGIVNDEQRRQIINQLREKRRRAQNGDFAPVFLTGDISVEDPQLQLPDQSFIAHRMRNRHEIFIALGVPASMADIVASYSVGSASDRFLLIEETCMPQSEKLAEGVSQATEILFGERVVAWFNWDEHSVMRQVRAERLESMSKLCDRGMPVSAANEYLQLGLPAFEGWDRGHLPFSVAPVSVVDDPMDSTAGDPANLPMEGNGEGERGGEGEEESAIKTLRRLFCENSTKGKQAAAWRMHMASRRPQIRNFISKFSRALQPARAEVLRKIQIGGKLPKAGHVSLEIRAAAADFLFDLPEFSKGLSAQMRTASLAALTEAGRQLFRELRKDDPFTMPPEEVSQFLATRQNRIKGVANDVFENIRQELQAGLDAGEGIDKLSSRIKGAFNQIGREQAERVAMTETAAAYGAGRQKAMAQAGVQFKQWLTSGLENVRPEHEAANGQTVGVNETFSVGGETLAHPGDPSGSPWNVINCHCVAIPVESPED